MVSCLKSLLINVLKDKQFKTPPMLRFLWSIDITAHVNLMYSKLFIWYHQPNVAFKSYIGAID